MGNNMIIRKIKKKEEGFSLIELILVLGLSGLAFISLVQWEMKKSEIVRAEVGGEQLAEVGKALTAYIAREQDALSKDIVPGTVKTIPLNRLQGVNSDSSLINAGGTNCYPVTPGVICGRPYLPTTFSTNNVLGFGYSIQVRNIAGRLEGLVISSNAVCEKGVSLACPTALTNEVKYEWIGSAMKKIGAQGGMIPFGSTTTISGYNAGWSISNTEVPSFTGINTAGKIAMRVGLTDTALYDAQYLRLDGTSVMRGNLNMGNWDIQNATNITYNGWLQGFGVLANTINSGSINNTGDIQTRGLYATTVMKAGAIASPVSTANIAAIGTGSGSTVGVGQIQTDNSVVANNAVVAMRAVSTRDIFLGNSDGNVSNPNLQIARRSGTRTVPNLWLSDLLPKYSSRGIYRVNDFTIINRPNCGTGGTPKIEVIPQMTYSHGRVLGTNQLAGTLVTGSWGAGDNGLRINWDLAAYSPNLAYANPGPGATQWTVRLTTANYSAAPNSLPTFAMTGLAHIYCDYGF
jgi:type II secretory pathway pseudopilin PulG